MMNHQRQQLLDRITAYLSGGGLFNPELAIHVAVRDLLIDIRDHLVVKATAPECNYTVGTTSDGMMTVLKVGDVHTTTTLTLNEVATRRLIRMLEATLEENEE